MKRLYELAPEYAEVTARVDAGEPLSDVLDSITTELQVKLDNVFRMLAQLKADAAAFKAEEDRLAERRRPCERQADELRAYVKDCMVKNGITKIETPLARFTISESKPRVVIEDEMSVPPQYIRTSIEVDKDAVLKAWKSDGECVSGTKIEPSFSLRIT